MPNVKFAGVVRAETNVPVFHVLCIGDVVAVRHVILCDNATPVNVLYPSLAFQTVTEYLESLNGLPTKQRFETPSSAEKPGR